ncbi:hypothetical protein [Microbacterium tumbae]
MSDPQQPHVPPYATGAQPPAPQTYPGQPGYGAPQAQPAYPTQQPAYQAPAQPAYPAATQPAYPTAASQPAYPTAASQPAYSAAQPAASAAPGYGAPQGYPAAAAPAGPGNPPGRIGFIIGLAGLVVGLLFSIVSQVTLYSGAYESVGIISGIGGILTLLTAIAALVLGIIGLRRRGAPLAQAGIATGLGIAGVASGVFSFLISSMSAIFYAF